MKVAIMIMAAGESRRFSRCKLLAAVSSTETLLSRTVTSALTSDIGDVYIITGRWHEDVQKYQQAGYLTGSSTLHCSSWQHGLGSSIAFGVRKLAASYDAILITLADQIDIDAMQLQSLITAYKGGVVCAKYAGKRGVPALFPKEHFESLKSLSGDVGAKKLLNEGICSIEEVELSSASIDIDTVEELSLWKQRKQGNQKNRK
ncbi:nucleotidyltransferase family protein [Vibrio maerlii]|uniref:nucleotidyltransferase family protein n=1 Tax=Vibrio maerlii TaxID=2231648 RepID=UPI000E3C2E57|nr:nucleotidyltransferase family protein [Vibrio maerlii]